MLLECPFGFRGSRGLQEGWSIALRGTQGRGLLGSRWRHENTVGESLEVPGLATIGTLGVPSSCIQDRLGFFPTFN